MGGSSSLEKNKTKCLEEEKKNVYESKAGVSAEKAKQPLTAFYDIIIHPSSLADLAGTKGWQINDFRTRKENNPGGVVACILGRYNSGKSFLLSKIYGLEAPATHTEYLSIVSSEKTKKHLTCMDTKGWETPLAFIDTPALNNPYNIIQDQQICEILIQDFLVESSDIIIVVVEEATFSDLKRIRNIHQAILGTTKRIIVVHNYSRIEKKKDVEAHIRAELQGIYDLEETSWSSNLRIYCSKTSSSEAVHLIMAKDGTEAGKYYNDQAVEYILKAFCNVISLRAYDPVTQMKQFLAKSLHRFMTFIDCEGQVELTFKEKEGSLKIIQIPKTNLIPLQFNPGEWVMPLVKDEIKYELSLGKTSTGNLRLRLETELAGLTKDDILKVQTHVINNAILIMGSKSKIPQEEWQVLSSTRQIGEFVAKTLPLDPSFRVLNPESPTITYTDGMYVVEWEIKEQGQWL